MSIRRKFLRLALSAAALGLLAASLPNVASAAPTIQLTGVIQDGSGAVIQSFSQGPVVGAAGPGFTQIVTPGFTNFSGIVLGPLGASHIASDPNISPINTSPGALLSSILDQLTNTVGGTAGVVNRIATVAVSASNFTNPAPFLLALNASGSFLNAAGSSFSASWYENPTNQLATVTGSGSTVTFNPNGSIQVDGTFNTAATVNTLSSFQTSNPGTASPSSATPFGMTLLFTIRLTPGAILQTRFQSELALGATVPEPTTVAAAVSGLPVLGLLWARRRRRQS